MCLFVYCDQDLINQGRQKVIEATNALKTLTREPLEDTISRIVSVKMCNMSSANEDNLFNRSSFLISATRQHDAGGITVV